MADAPVDVDFIKLLDFMNYFSIKTKFVKKISTYTKYLK